MRRTPLAPRPKSGSPKASSSRFTAALTFNPTEFSRLRAQYENATIRVDGGKETWGRFLLQLQLSLGAHGAHAF